MKCKYCGGDVTLDDHFCPHCGRPVDQAQRHQREMKQYEAEFEETKQEALETIAAGSGDGTAFGIRLTAIAVLLFLLIFLVFRLEPYGVNERRRKNEAKIHHDAYVAQMEEYIKDRDYVALSSFCKIHQLEYNDDYKEYRDFLYGVSYFYYVYKGLQELAFATPDNVKYMYYATELSKNVNQFYYDMDQVAGKTGAVDQERTEALYKEMDEEMGILLQKYLNLSKEKTDSLKSLSKSKRTILIEQALDQVLTEKTGSGLSEAVQAEGSEKEDEQAEAPQTGSTQAE